MTDHRIPVGLGPMRQRILEVALGELDRGVRERPAGSNRGPRVDVYLPTWARTKPGPAWCSWFACWVLTQALGHVPTGRARGGVATLRRDARLVGLWTPKGDGSIVPGDLVCLDYGRGKGHVGVVIGVDGKELATIEGNVRHAVRFGRRRLSDPLIVGTICTVPAEPCPDFARGIPADAKALGKATTR